MLGRAIIRTGRIAQIRALSSTANVRSSDVAVSGGDKGGEYISIVTPEDKSIFTETPPPEEIGQELKDKWYPQLGNRDVVGAGYSAHHDYFDTPDDPMPGVRFAANTPEVLALRTKEKGDWKTLSLEEKKQLYRNSYQKTFAEIEAPTGDWKRIFSHIIMIFGITLFYQIYIATRLRTLPVGYDQMSADNDVRYSVMVGNNPITGIASKYDYEKNQWK